MPRFGAANGAATRKKKNSKKKKKKKKKKRPRNADKPPKKKSLNITNPGSPGGGALGAGRAKTPGPQRAPLWDCFFFFFFFFFFECVRRFVSFRFMILLMFVDEGRGIQQVGVLAQAISRNLELRLPPG
jgi:hypothetical protein